MTQCDMGKNGEILGMSALDLPPDGRRYTIDEYLVGKFG